MAIHNLRLFHTETRKVYATIKSQYIGVKAIGVGDYLAHTSLRIGFGRFTTEDEVDFAIKETVAEVGC